MEEYVLDPRFQGIPLAQLALVAAIVAGAVSGAVSGWLSKRNAGLALCTLMIGIMGGLLMGTGMGRWFYLFPGGTERVVQAGIGSLFDASLAGLAGSIPTALLMPSVVIFITLRHVKNRPPRVMTGLQAASVGILAGTLSAIALLLV
jgi:hypothetical protein